MTSLSRSASLTSARKLLRSRSSSASDEPMGERRERVASGESERERKIVQWTAQIFFVCLHCIKSSHIYLGIPLGQKNHRS
jgi:hypothetical protein